MVDWLPHENDQEWEPHLRAGNCKKVIKIKILAILGCQTLRLEGHAGLDISLRHKNKFGIMYAECIFLPCVLNTTIIFMHSRNESLIYLRS